MRRLGPQRGGDTPAGGAAGAKSSGKVEPSREAGDREYLERHGVNTCLQEMVGAMLENRPADPVVFAADYLEHAAALAGRAGGDPMERCYRYIRLAVPGSPSFMDNLAAGYAAVDLQLGLNGFRLAELVRRLCKGLPFEAFGTVLGRLRAGQWGRRLANGAEALPGPDGGGELERVEFGQFVEAVELTLAYHQFVLKARAVHKVCAQRHAAVHHAPPLSEQRAKVAWLGRWGWHTDLIWPAPATPSVHSFSPSSSPPSEWPGRCRHASPSPTAGCPHGYFCPSSSRSRR